MTAELKVLQKLQFELLDLKAQTEANALHVAALRRELKELKLSEQREKCDVTKTTLFRVASLSGIVILLCAIWWVYFTTDEKLVEIHAAITSEASEHPKCTMIPSPKLGN